MYTVFSAAEPSIAEVCCFTTFKSLKPWYITKPHRRSCECVYHTKMRMVREAAMSHANLSLFLSTLQL